MEPTISDRLAMRERPAGMPVMHQGWGDLLFIHWTVPVDLLRPLVPAALEIDTFEGAAWVGIAPLNMWGVRPPGLPSLPFVSRSLEINVRTYVHRDKMPGVWFFSLDAENPLLVLGSRLGYRLPYFKARMSLDRRGGSLRFVSRRTHGGSAPAEFDGLWEPGAHRPEPAPESLDFFLVERYCLYSADGENLYSARVHHRPWQLREARLHHLASTMLEAQGLPSPTGAPLLHAQGAPLDVWVWLLEKVG